MMSGSRPLKIVSLSLIVSAFILVPFAPPAGAAVLNVTTFNDELNDDSDCSFREALVTVNTGVAQSNCPEPEDTNTIALKKGIYMMEIGGIDEEDGETGDFDILSDGTTIRGRGARKTIVDGADLDRVFDIAGFNTHFLDLTIRDGKLLSPNDEEYSGGGIFTNHNGTLLKRVRLLSNEVGGLSNLSENGGGIVAVGSTLTIEDSEIANNKASRGGGILSNSLLTIKETTIHHNEATAGDHGGGLEIHGPTTFRNVTVANNDGPFLGDRAGGIAIGDGGSLIMRRSTIASNRPGNIALFAASSELEFSSSIIADPLLGENCDDPANSDPQGIVLNIDEDGTCSTNDAFMVDPQLRPLANNGGPGPTLALKPTSPAINASLEDCVKTDARGVPRPQFNCDAAADNNQDLGAYELVRCAKAIVTIVGTPGADTLNGTGNADGVLALGGKDKVFSGGGKDKVCGGDENDTLRGESGDDTLLGQGGNDSLNGGPNRDKCVGGPGADSAVACEITRSL
jgi:CSLREA domain-containing protein